MFYLLTSFEGVDWEYDNTLVVGLFDSPEKAVSAGFMDFKKKYAKWVMNEHEENNEISESVFPEEFQQKIENLEKLNDLIEKSLFRSRRHLDEFYYMVTELEINKMVE
jgi:DNA-binding MurR/RpiR family transcriptional regulator